MRIFRHCYVFKGLQKLCVRYLNPALSIAVAEGAKVSQKSRLSISKKIVKRTIAIFFWDPTLSQNGIFPCPTPPPPPHPEIWPKFTKFDLASLTLRMRRGASSSSFFLFCKPRKSSEIRQIQNVFSNFVRQEQKELANSVLAKEERNTSGLVFPTHSSKTAHALLKRGKWICEK